MQKILVTTLLILASSLASFASIYTFQVDMRGFTGPTYTTVNLNGTFNGWCGACNPMSDADGDSIWTLTLDLPLDTLEYKFSLDGWTQQENLMPGLPCTKTTGGFTNRYIVSSVDTVIDVVCYDSCVACPGLSAAPTQNLITFQVDMKEYSGPYTTVYVNGDFNGWCGSCNPMSDPDNDSVWTVTLPIVGDSIEYKFTVDTWTDQEMFAGGEPCTKTTGGFTNRFVATPGGTIVLDEVCWGECVDCIPNITFAVDLRGYTGAHNYSGVFLNGDFNGWCGACNPMFDPDGDSIWTVEIPLAAATIEYKFSLDGWTDQENLTPGDPCTVTNFGFTNRALTFNQDVVLDTVCWEACVGCTAITPPDTVTFAVDLRGYTGTHNYSGVYLNGTFNGWCGACNVMSDADGDSIWTLTLPLNAGPIEYKFSLDGWTDQENLTPGDPCTVTAGGFTNRSHTVAGNAVLDTVCWNACVGCNSVTPPDTVTFNVDMRGYTGTHNYTVVHLNGDFNGWCGGCNAMSDADGDSIWTLTLPINADSIEYKFTLDAWTDQENFAGGESCTKTAGGFTNRFTLVSNNLVLDTVCWNSCDTCDFTIVPDTVTFAVDLRGYTGTHNYTTVNLNGDFAGWCGACIPMTDPDGDSIWTVSVALNPGPIEYKFTLDGWTDQENFVGGEPCTVTGGGFTNRSYTVAGNALLDTVCWNSCDPCNLTPAPNPQFCDSLVTHFGIPAEIPSSSYLTITNISPTQMRVSIYSADADPIDDMTIPSASGGTIGALTNSGGVYSRTITWGTAPTDVDLNVLWSKASFGGNWQLNPTDVTVTFADACPIIPDTVLFSVDLRGYTGTHNYTTVNLNGDFAGWCGACIPMVDPDGDSIWTVSVAINPGPIEYKFTLDGWTDQESLTPGDPCTVTGGGFTNRSYNVAGNAVLDTVCWNSCYECGFVPVPDTITFAVDLRGYTGTHNYTTVNLNGNFAGWCGACIPMVDPDGDSIWTVSVPLNAGTIEYKFTLDGWTDQENLTPGDPCTVTGGGFTNRVYTVAGNALLDTVCWNSCDACILTPPAPNTQWCDTLVTHFGIPGEVASSAYLTITKSSATEMLVSIYSADADPIDDMSIPSASGGTIGALMNAGGVYSRTITWGTPPTDVDLNVLWSKVSFGGNWQLNPSDVTVTFADSCIIIPDTVTFAVDLRGYTGTHNYTTVNLNGDFAGWCGACIPMVDPDGDSIWTVSVALNPGPIEYKFTLDGWTDQENLTPGDPCTVTAGGFTNRSHTVTGNAVLDTVCWNLCDPCNFSVAPDTVTFAVDLRGYTGTHNYTTVNLNGNFAGWCGACIPMVDPDGDSIWTVTIPLAAGPIEYKFTLDGWTDQESLTPGDPCTVTAGGFTNRSHTVAGNAVLDTVCWNSCNPCSAPAPVPDTVTFAVDLTGYTGIINYTTVYVNGDFNSWCGGCNPMSDPDGDSIWTVTLPLLQDSIEYKFTVDGWTDQENLTPGDPCTKTTGGFTNRFTLVSNNLMLDTVCWNECDPCMGPPPVIDIDTVTFKVDMRGYTGAVNYSVVNVNGTFNGWCGGCNPMSDPDNDSIWTVTLLLSEDSIEYKFTVDGWTDQEALTVGDFCTKTTGGFTNRFLSTTGAGTYDLDAVCWNKCIICPDPDVVNDECIDAELINFNYIYSTYAPRSTSFICRPIYGTNIGAGTDPSEPASSCSGTGIAQPSLWYEMAMPACGPFDLTISVDNAATNFDATLTLYSTTSTTCDYAQFTEIACNALGFGGCAPGASTAPATLTFNNLNPGETYYLKVSNYDPATSTGAFSGDFELTATIEPDPLTLAANATSPESMVDVMFPTTLGNDHFDFFYGMQGSPGFNVIWDMTSTAPITVSGLQPATTYEFWTSTNCDGTPDDAFYTPVTDITTGAAVCTTPDPLQCLTTTSSSIQFQWTNVSSANHYHVFYRRVGQAGYSALWNVMGTSVTLSNLQSMTNYEIWVYAVCDGPLALKSLSLFCSTTSSINQQSRVELNGEDKLFNFTYNGIGFYDYEMYHAADFASYSGHNETRFELSAEGELIEYDSRGQRIHADYDVSFMDFDIYPNPATNGGEVAVDFFMEQSSDVTIELRSLQGSLIQLHTLGEVQYQISHKLDVSKLAAGVYNVTVRNKMGTVTNKLVIAD